jgi:hypothetical protein
MKYTLSETINLINSGMKYNIPDEILEIINDLSSQVGAPNYVKTPVFAKRNFEKDKKIKPSRRKKTNEEWTKKTVFKTTKIEKSVGLNKNVDDIRMHLNKLSDKNFDDIFNNIVKVIDDLANEDENKNENYKNIGCVIFELASGNRFYSETYAKFYCDLASKYEFMNDTLRENCDVYIETFNELNYVDANDNYEGFCEMNKANETRRSLSAFLVNLMKNGVLSRELINNFLVTLLCKFDELLNSDKMKNEANELCENICLLFDDTYDYSNYTIKKTMSVNNYLNHLAKSNITEFKSYSNKTKFKIMDLLNM